ncbi:hypothetical protein HNR43_001283 [Anoxybacillus mongoliensis]|uniref:Uncharacterized protein n=1 Tax=Anoxybacillus mongoliensis TaxID=452565 RepID=A0A7W8JDZ6_9BACL|nr:hypothetical protein [Anoxybacillus mongoliensis]
MPHGAVFSRMSLCPSLVEDSVKAFKVAAKAGNGKLPIHDDPHECKDGYLPHWHIYNRSGGHSFY